MKAQKANLQLPTKSAFLQEIGITLGQFARSGLKWKDLQEIHYEYSSRVEGLVPVANYYANTLALCPAVHATRQRVKTPRGVIEKIIRKTVNGKAPWIDLSRYLTEYPDLVAIRALHLFQRDWPSIHAYIQRIWVPTKAADAYLREDEIPSTREMFKKNGCNILHPETGYQSVHYDTINPIGDHVHVEIQVRTLYQEAWGEISHVTAYPETQSSPLVKFSVDKLAKITAVADHFASLIKDLKFLVHASEPRRSRGAPYRDAALQYAENLRYVISHPYDEGAQLLLETTSFTPETLRAAAKRANDRQSGLAPQMKKSSGV